jgi:hypothetical protein
MLLLRTKQPPQSGAEGRYRMAGTKTVTYRIAGMRVTFPTGKVAQKNPERFATIHGVFSDTKGVKLSIVSKNVTMEEAKNAATVIDQPKGILTLPAGERGRKPVPSATNDAVAAALAKVRKG